MLRYFGDLEGSEDEENDSGSTKKYDSRYDDEDTDDINDIEDEERSDEESTEDLNSNHDFDYLDDRKFLVLDLDSTLIHTFDSCDNINKISLNSSKNYDIKSRLYNIPVYDLHSPKGTKDDPVTFANNRICGIKRPGLNDFLKFCFDNFEVLVWSAGTQKYVKSICDEVFDDIYYPRIIYSRKNCLFDGSHIRKPLRKMMAENTELSNMKLNNTLIIDDRPDYVLDYNPDNSIIIPAFSPSDNNISKLRKPDNSLPQLTTWLKKNMDAPDVRTLNKTNIFS